MASDDFNRANATDLGANWSQACPTLGANTMDINTNAARVDTQSADVWNTAFDEDQYTQVILGNLDSTAHAWFFINCAATGMASFTGYLLDMIQGTTDCSLALYRGNAGSYTTIVSTVSGIALSSGDTWYLGKVGADLTVKRNGTPVSSFNGVTDSSPLTGNGYCGIGGNSTSLITFTEWEGGAITLPPVSITPESLYSAG